MKLIALLLSAPVVFAQSSLPPRAIAQISPDTLRGRTSFLASDLLEGRDTPSRGLNAAASYIASEFRRAGLVSPPSGDFLQSAEFLEITERRDGLQLRFALPGSHIVDIDPEAMASASFRELKLDGEPVFKWTAAAPMKGSLAGKILMLRAPSDVSLVGRLALARPDAIVQITRKRLPKDEGEKRLIPTDLTWPGRPPVISITDSEMEELFDGLPAGLTRAAATLHIPAPKVEPFRLHSVVGILRGCDPQLREQYVIISAHYDHLGTRVDSGQRRVYHGANDDASGTAAVMELAAAFARESPAPKRTLVFVCFFGEEKGLIGSQSFVDHPLFPLAQIVADVNLEQVGLAEPALGKGTLEVTGSDLSDLPERFALAMKPSGVRLVESHGDSEYFDRSDHLPFARAGIPAHTFLGVFNFEDYHQPSDTWQKLDYENMATLTRGLASAIFDLANRETTPRWNVSNKQADGFAAIWRARHQ